MKLIKQKNSHDCVIASLAMALRKTYEEISKLFHPSYKEEGVSCNDIISFLLESNLKFIYTEFYYQGDRQQAIERALDTRYRSLIFGHRYTNSTAHAMYLDKDGKIYCPSGKWKSKDIRKEIYVITSRIEFLDL